MATYLELRDLFNDGDLLNKIDVAIIVAANDLIAGSPTAKDKAWAAAALSNPRPNAENALKALLADNKAVDIATIQATSDTGIQTAVDGVVPILVDALAGV